MIAVLLGPPGAGKGTQAERFAEYAGLSHVSTGDLFRENLRAGTPLGEEARRYMARGELVPDEVVIGMVKERLAASGGYVLDGFPRTVAQAEALDGIVADRDGCALSAVVLSVPRPEVVRRLTGRRVCAAGSHVYHVDYRPPRVAGVCDVDGSPLVQREDDQEETVVRRLEVYEQETGPVIEYYAAHGGVLTLDGTGSPDEVQARLRGALPRAEAA